MKRKKTLISAAAVLAFIGAIILLAPPKDPGMSQMQSIGSSHVRDFSKRLSGGSGRGTNIVNNIYNSTYNIARNSDMYSSPDNMPTRQKASEQQKNIPENSGFSDNSENMDFTAPANQMQGGMTNMLDVNWWQLVAEYNVNSKSLAEKYGGGALTVKDNVFDTGVLEISGTALLPYVVFEHSGMKAYMYFDENYKDEVLALKKSAQITISGGNAVFERNSLKLYGCSF